MTDDLGLRLTERMTKSERDQTHPNVEPRDTIFPIPQAVIDANIGKPMEQNPGF